MASISWDVTKNYRCSWGISKKVQISTFRDSEFSKARVGSHVFLMSNQI